MFTRVLLLLLLLDIVFSGNLYDLVLESVKCSSDLPTNLSVSELKLYTYNYNINKNNAYNLSEASERIQAASDFDSEQCFHIFIPGFQNNINSTAPDVVRCALANYTCNSKNIVLAIIDHSAYTSGNIIQDLNYVALYQKAFRYTKSISIAIGTFIASMVKILGQDKVIASGHSLGGQMVGQSAERSKNLGYPLKKIVAIDPAGPCFKDHLDEHVKSGQADMVIAIHCNAGELGSNLNLTDIDGYSGNGVTQVGCKGGNAIDLLIKGEASICSHSKCVPITMQTAIESDLWKATQCDSYTDLQDGSCDDNDETIVGYKANTSKNKDIYYFQPSENLTCTS